VGNVIEKCTGTGNSQKCKITGKLRVKSDGNQDVSTSTYVDFYLQGDVQDTLIKRTKVGKLKKGKSTVLTITWTSPVGKSAKGKYIYAMVDADDTVEETDENNNKIYFNNIL
jgi:subtilase family serine protease